MSIERFEEWRKQYRPYLTESQFIEKAFADFSDVLDKRMHLSMLRGTLERLYKFKNLPVKTEATICRLLEPSEGPVRVIAYRGEHGRGGVLESRLPSLSFANRDVALYYALYANESSDTVFEPRVIEAEIVITNPFKTSIDDPFVDGASLCAALGREKTVAIFGRLEEALRQTDNFAELCEEYDVSSFEELVNVAGEQVVEDLYVDAYTVFDEPDFVTWFVEAGFDGVMHGGNEVSELEVEYKVFNPNQVRVLNVLYPAAKNDDIDPDLKQEIETQTRAAMRM